MNILRYYLLNGLMTSQMHHTACQEMTTVAMLSAVLDDHDLKHVWLQQLFETLAESGKTIHLKKR